MSSLPSTSSMRFDELLVTKRTGCPAQRYRLSDRGLIRKGLVADLVAFAPDAVRDRADFRDTNVPSEGVRFVWKRGTLVVRDGRMVAGPSGMCLRATRG